VKTWTSWATEKNFFGCEFLFVRVVKGVSGVGLGGWGVLEFGWCGWKVVGVVWGVGVWVG